MIASPLRTAHLLDELPVCAAARDPGQIALVAGARSISYGDLCQQIGRAAAGFRSIGAEKGSRIAIYSTKSIESVVLMLAAARIGSLFIPINPVLKPEQVRHILVDSEAITLCTTASRAAALSGELSHCTHLSHLVTMDDSPAAGVDSEIAFSSLISSGDERGTSRRTLETDPVAILYTSGSTGKPKGVVLSHRNVVVGATSVAEYLENTPDDRILSVLPLSFDAGFSQITTAFSASATVVLLDYLLPRDVVRVCERERITGITGVPPLWMQLAQQEWPTESARHLRYFANTGGKMPRDTLQRLRAHFPRAKPFLMYGLTEAFRSTYLPPNEVDRRPDSIGKAIPNVEVMVVRPDGTPCAPHEPGELVHRGPLVALGYWKDVERTRERYRPAPGQCGGLPNPELAVWSGDTVTMDEDGFLYFVGRKDDMIKTSGYRVSPTEIEEMAFQSGYVTEAAAVGIQDDALGQAIIVVARPSQEVGSSEELAGYFRAKLPAYMVPRSIIWRDELPRNPNGKIDRKALKAELESGPEAAR